jgi:hypothetical protein
LGGATTTRTFDQSASSSSARISGSEVSEPCPISAAGDMIATTSSVAIVTHGLIFVPDTSDPTAAAAAAPMSPRAMAKENPAAPTMNWRRDGAQSVERSKWIVMAQASFAARSMARTMRG